MTDNSSNMKQFMSIKKEIQTLKEEKIKSKAILESNMKKLKEFGCENVKEAERKIKQLGKQMQRLNKEVEKNIEEMEEFLNAS